MASLFGASSPGHSSMGYYNPAFKIRIVNPSDSLQQQESPGRPNQKDDFIDNLAVGQRVMARIGNRKVKGKIVRIFRNDENEGVFAEIMTKDGKTHKIDGSRLYTSSMNDGPDGQPNEDQERAISSPAMFAEGHIMTFESFISK